MAYGCLTKCTDSRAGIQLAKHWQGMTPPSLAHLADGKTAGGEMDHCEVQQIVDVYEYSIQAYSEH